MTKQYNRWRYLPMKKKLSHRDYMELERSHDPITTAKNNGWLDDTKLKKLIREIL